ncbi:MAG: DUF5723 family protein [Bacteroides sp.]|nr:DUF5723 family protein [Bacteroides sp.]
MKKLYIASALAIAATFGAQAQEASRSGYFMDGYSFRHELNPAFSNDHNFISIPALGNLNVGLSSNVGVNTFLYKLPDGRLTTFMSPTVGNDEFLSKLSDNNKINTNLNLTLLSAGFKAFGGFNTITISARNQNGINLPRGLFEFMKLGQQGESSSYSFKDLRIKATAFAQVALGHSHAINEHIEVGAKVKVLVGAGSVDAKIDQMDLTLSDTRWQVNAKGSVNAAAGTGLKVPTKGELGKDIDRPEQANQIEWGDIDYDKFSTTGFGLGFDLGAVYKNVIPGLTVSASVLDLGFISWNHNVKGETPQTQWSFDGFNNIALDSSQPGYEENKLGQQFDNMWDDFKDCMNFDRKEVDGSRSQALAATIHLGAEYEMPFYQKLTAGFLYTQHINGPFSWAEGRLSANVKPVKWFDCTLNVGQSTYGTAMGWMLNFHPRGFNFFIGSDHQFFKITPQVLPVGNANMNVNIGFNVTFG